MSPRQMWRAVLAALRTAIAPGPDDRGPAVIRLRSGPDRTAFVELIAVGAVALGLGVAAVAVLLADEPLFRRALGSPPFAVEANAAVAPAGAASSRGAQLFQALGCVGCHAGPGIRRGSAPEIGPDLSRLREVAATRRPGTSAEAYVAESIREPGAFVVPGYDEPAVMPRFGLPDADVDALVDFLLAPPGGPSASGRGAPSGGGASAPGGGAPSGDGLPGQSPPPPRVLERSFDPAPPDAAYPTVWVGDDVTMVIRFAEGPAPRGEVLTSFTQDDGHGSLTVSVRAEQIAPLTWRASFALPRVGRWEGRDQFAGGGGDGQPFALRAIRSGPSD